MDLLSGFLQILGSLGVFLFGMKVLSEGIQKTAGERMRQIMATMTHNRLAGVGTGFITTCLLQSSSATTVIVVSFVNAGLLTLVESIGVIMGANLGTTLTAWIIALVGKFSLAKIALPIIGIGMPFIFAGKGRWKSGGEILIGFGLLFFGLGLLKEAVPDVKSMLNSTDDAVRISAEHWQHFIKGLSGYGYLSLLMFLAGGVVLTLAVQSSSAAMAITVTLALNGWIGFEESCAIVLGENIGTTVTAWLASLGANTNAKRAARAHFLFNILGVIWMLIVFYGFTHLVLWLGEQLPDSLRTKKHDSDIGFNLAIFHSLFNFLNIALLVGFVPLIAKVVSKWVKDDGEDEGRLTYITSGMLELGELNLPEAENAVDGMASLVEEMFTGFVQVFDSPNTDMSETVTRLKSLEDQSDVLMADITEYLVRCSSAELSDRNASSVSSMMRNVAELEEAADCVYRLIKLTERRYRKSHTLPEEVLEGLRSLSSTVGNFVSFTRSNLRAPISLTAINEAKQFERQSDEMRDALNKAALRRMQDGGDIKSEMLHIDINNNLEKLADHCLHVVQNAAAVAE
jgi:phosphate:Na+ symporter